MIILRDQHYRGGVRLPAWLEGCSELQRMQTDNGDLITAGDPLFLVDPVGAVWHELGDGYQVTTTNGIDHHRYLRRRSDIERILVRDAQAREWFAPRILDEAGDCALAVPWGKLDGVRVRKPTGEQQRCITSANAARKEILAGRIGDIPIDIIAEWVHALLEATYHLSGEIIDALELMDDTLALGVMFASSGFPKPTDQAAAHVQV